MSNDTDHPPVFIDEAESDGSAWCEECHHIHTPDGCTGPATPSDIWAGVSVESCDCDAGR